MKRRRDFLGELIQLAGVLMLGSGITLELIKGGDIYLIVITVGYIVFTIGTKIKGG